jgi:putative transposase
LLFEQNVLSHEGFGGSGPEKFAQQVKDEEEDMPHCHRFRSVVLLGKSAGAPLEWSFYEFAIDRHHVLFVMRLMTREVHIAGMIPEPCETWTLQTARNLTDACDGFLRGNRFLIHDRSTLFTEQFRETLKSAGVEPLRLPVRSPNLNAFAESFVRSIKESCVERMSFFGESALRRVVSEFALHYHTERNHQSFENKIIRPEFTEFPDIGAIRSRQRLGGLLRYYYREAA